MTTERKERWLMVALIVAAMLAGPALSRSSSDRHEDEAVYKAIKAATKEAIDLTQVASDAHWTRMWIQRSNHLDDNAEPLKGQ